MLLSLCASFVCLKNVLVNKVRILENFKCICPTCYMHATMASTSSVKQSLDLESMITAPSYKGQTFE